MTSGNPTAVPIEDTFASSDVEEAIDAESAERGEAPSAIGARKKSFASIAFGSKSSSIIFVIVLIIPVIQIVIGWHYKDSCPVNWRIPNYLLVAGAVGLGALLVSIGQLIIAQCWKGPAPDSVACAMVIFAACSACGFLVFIILMTLFLFGWFIAGCVWVFSAWNQVQYTNEEESNYCNPVLYRFSFWLLFVSILTQLFLSVRGCFQVHHEVAKLRQ